MMTAKTRARVLSTLARIPPRRLRSLTTLLAELPPVPGRGFDPVSKVPGRGVRAELVCYLDNMTFAERQIALRGLEDLAA
jgi:hypothetical protein